MANSALRRRLTDRDFEILASIDQCPLTVLQLLKLSETFPGKVFTSLRSLQDRLQKLRSAGWVRRWPYAMATHGSAPDYYKVTLQSHRLLHDDHPPPTKRHFTEIGVARHHHTHSLADFLVHTLVAAHRCGIRLAHFYRENTLRLAVGEDSLFPDGAFELLTRDGRQYNFLIELDNGSERVRSDKDTESWQRKIRLYHLLRAQSQPHRFRVLVVTTRSGGRLDAILSLAAKHAPHARPSLFYGVHLPAYLAEPDAIHSPCFLDHNRANIPLIPRPPPRDLQVRTG